MTSCDKLKFKWFYIQRVERSYVTSWGEFCSRTSYQSVVPRAPLDIFGGLASLILHRLKATIIITSVRPGAITLVFRVATLCNQADMCWRFGQTYYLHLQGRTWKRWYLSARLQGGKIVLFIILSFAGSRYGSSETRSGVVDGGAARRSGRNLQKCWIRRRGRRTVDGHPHCGLGVEDNFSP
jgi:hypothetical protein